jgi:hypothetical protein
MKKTIYILLAALGIAFPAHDQYITKAFSAAYSPDYCEAFIIVTLKAEEVTPAVYEYVDEETVLVTPAINRAVLDVPFPWSAWQGAIDHRVVIDSTYLDESYVGREILVHINYKPQYQQVVESMDGYIGVCGCLIMQHPRYAEFWNQVDELNNPTPFVPNCGEGYEDR